MIKRIVLQPAYVIHRRAFGETSAIIDFFTADFGRVGAVAKGINNGKSKRKALLQPFAPLLIGWSGRSELVTLTSVEAAAPAFYLQKQILLSGLYLNELIQRLVQQGEAYTVLYDYYCQALQQLSSSDSAQPILRLFEKRLLLELGYGLQLEHAEKNQPIVDHLFYRYDNQRGFVCLGEQTTSQLCFSGASLKALFNDDFSEPNQLKEMKLLMRCVLTPLLGHRPLQSRQLFVRDH